MAAEITNGLGALFVPNLEVVFCQVRHELVAAIEDGEEDVHQVDDLGDFALILLLRRRFLCGSGLRWCGILRLSRGAIGRLLLRAIACPSE